MFSKTTLTRYQQPIEVKNTHQHDIKIQLEEQLPRSEDEKIKVPDDTVYSLCDYSQIKAS